MSKETAEKKTALVLLVAHEAVEKGSRALRFDDIHLLRTSEPELTDAEAGIGDLLIWLLDTDLYKPNANRDALLKARDDIWRLRPEVRERYRELLSRPHFDGPLHDGEYPSEVALDWIRAYDCLKDGAADLVGAVITAWWMADYLTRWRDAGDGTWELDLSTGGWSDNEAVIEALQNNHTFWPHCWVQSRRGGHFWFIVSEWMLNPLKVSE